MFPFRRCDPNQCIPTYLAIREASQINVPCDMRMIWLASRIVGGLLLPLPGTGHLVSHRQLSSSSLV